MHPPDYHLHTRFSCDSDASMHAMCRAALAHGLTEIGFSEHMDLIPHDPHNQFFKAAAWWEGLEQCRADFRGLLRIRAGIELGEPHLFSKELRPLLEQYPWDYTLASLHWIGPDQIFQPEFFERTEQEAYRDYFAEQLRMVSSSDFDILAHMDIIKRFGFEHYGGYDPRSVEDYVRPVLQELAARDRALEVNTGLLRRSVNQTSPSALILRWFREEGGRWVTIGSDAHLPEHVGAGMAQAVTNLTQAGFTAVTQFDGRRPHPFHLHSGDS